MRAPSQLVTSRPELLSAKPVTVLNPRQDDLVTRFLEHTAEQGIDLVFDTTGENRVDDQGGNNCRERPFRGWSGAPCARKGRRSIHKDMILTDFISYGLSYK